MIAFALLAAAPVFAQQQQTQRVERSLPVFFIPNAGQVDPSVLYIVDTPGLNAGFGSTGAVFQLGRLTLHIGFAGGNPHATIEGQERLKAAANFLIGNRPQEWHTNLPVYQKIRGFWS